MKLYCLKLLFFLAGFKNLLQTTSMKDEPSKGSLPNKNSTFNSFSISKDSDCCYLCVVFQNLFFHIGANEPHYANTLKATAKIKKLRKRTKSKSLEEVKNDIFRGLNKILYF